MNIGISPIFKKNVLVPFLIFFNLHVALSTIKKNPLISTKSTRKTNKSNFNDSDFISYLKENNFDKANIPFKSWGIDELLIAQKYFNPQLKTADLELEIYRKQ